METFAVIVWPEAEAIQRQMPSAPVQIAMHQQLSLEME